VDSSEITMKNTGNYSYNYPRYFEAHTATAELFHECKSAARSQCKIREAK
jgi:hypothetical protein